MYVFFFLLWPCALQKLSRRTYLKRQQERGENKRYLAWNLANEHMCPAPPELMILIICIISPWGSGCFPCMLHPFGDKLLAC